MARAFGMLAVATPGEAAQCARTAAASAQAASWSTGNGPPLRLPGAPSGALFLWRGQAARPQSRPAVLLPGLRNAILRNLRLWQKVLLDSPTSGPSPVPQAPPVLRRAGASGRRSHPARGATCARFRGPTLLAAASTRCHARPHQPRHPAPVRSRLPAARTDTAIYGIHTDEAIPIRQHRASLLSHRRQYLIRRRRRRAPECRQFRRQPADRRPGAAPAVTVRTPPQGMGHQRRPHPDHAPRRGRRGAHPRRKSTARTAATPRP